jgi:hypothetical protein
MLEVSQIGLSVVDVYLINGINPWSLIHNWTIHRLFISLRASLYVRTKGHRDTSKIPCAIRRCFSAINSSLSLQLLTARGGGGEKGSGSGFGRWNINDGPDGIFIVLRAFDRTLELWDCLIPRISHRRDSWANAGPGNGFSGLSTFFQRFEGKL